VNVEQETALRSTELYNVYAIRDCGVRNGSRARPAARQASAWSSPMCLSEDLRRLGRQKLPDYMVPSSFLFVDSVPLTANGKVDFAALADVASSSESPSRDIVLSRNPVEETLSRIWCEVLGLDGISIHESFFDLGGHSLLATRIISRISDEFGLDLSLRSFFQTPTIAGIASEITEHRNRRGLHGTPALALISSTPIRRSGSGGANTHAELGHLSEEEVESLLDELLSEEE
jgi:acyl carrier protein